MLVVYRTSTYLASRHALAAEAVFTLLGGFAVATILPALVIRMRGANISALGFTRKRIAVSLILSAVFAAGSLPAYFAAAPAGIGGVLLLVTSLLNLWEPLFVYGWLQLRLENAFGWVLAPFLTAFCFAAYHAGSAPLEMLGALLAWGAIVGVLFAFTRNLFVVFPLAWGVASAIGTASEASGAWPAVVLAVALLAGQLILLKTALASGESA